VGGGAELADNAELGGGTQRAGGPSLQHRKIRDICGVFGTRGRGE
jgi:hypothetical protein